MLFVATGTNEQTRADTNVFFDDVTLSFDGGVNWHFCDLGKRMSARSWASAAIDQRDYLFVLGGAQPDGPDDDTWLDDVWTSAFSLNDTLQLMSFCDIDSAVTDVPAQPGLQCWPPQPRCPNITLIGPVSVLPTSDDYTLVIALLNSEEDIARIHHVSLNETAFYSNLHVWSSYSDAAIPAQTNNFNLWPRGDIRFWGRTVFSSTSWSPALLTTAPQHRNNIAVRYTKVDATLDYACALTSYGAVLCWGRDERFVAWPRCQSALFCVMYGNLANVTDGLTSNPVFDHPYETFDAPSEHEPYTDMCVTSVYACAISNNIRNRGKMYCWMGEYQLGAIFRSEVDEFHPEQVNGCRHRVRDPKRKICPPSESVAQRDDYVAETFIALRCSAFSVCGVTSNGSVLCSSREPFTNASIQNINIGANDSPIVSLALTNNYQVCGITAAATIRCKPDTQPPTGLRLGELAISYAALAPLNTYRIGGGTDVAVCDGGVYSTHVGAVNSLCSGPCAAGYHGSADTSKRRLLNSSVCLESCPPGTWCPMGSAESVPCAVGTYNVYPRMSSSSNCLACSIGDICRAGADKAISCPAGAYCPSFTEQRPCPPGRFGNATGNTDENCSGPCAPGFLCTQYSVTDTQQPCPPGTYNDLPAQSECRACAPGTFAVSNANGTTACSNCSVGTFSTGAASQCLLCPRGEYNDEVGMSSCKRCPAGSSIDNRANATDFCAQCPPGKYSPDEGAAECLTCPITTYSLLNGSVSCSSCAGIDGVECSLGIAKILSTQHGGITISRADADSPVLLSLSTQPCPDGHCIGGVSTEFNVSDVSLYVQSGRTDTLFLPFPNQCTAHHDQTSTTILCGGCEPNHAPPDIGSRYTGCVPCEGTSTVKWLLFILVSWLLVIVYYIAANGRVGLIGALLYFVQTTAIMVSSQSSVTAWFRTFGFSPVSIMPAVCFAQMSPELQYAIPLMIVPLQLTQLVVVVIVHAIIKRYGKRPAYVLNAVTMTYLLSDDQYEHYYRRHRFVSVVWWAELLRYRVWPELTVSTVTRCVYLIMSASFTSVMLTCISWFQCSSGSQPVGLARLPGSVIYSFPAISCQSSSYFAWSFIMGGHIAISIVVIALLTVWISNNRRTLATLQLRAANNSEKTRAAHSSSQRELKPLVVLAMKPDYVQANSHSIVCGIPLLSIIRFQNYWPANTPTSSPESLLWDEPVVTAYNNENSRFESRREYAFRSIYGAVFDSFAANAIAWNVVILLRRLLLIVLSVTLTRLPSIKYMSFVYLHMIIYAAHIVYRPFVTQLLNDVETAAIVVHIIIAVLLTAFPGQEVTVVQSIVLSLTIAPVVGFFIRNIAHAQMTSLMGVWHNQLPFFNASRNTVAQPVLTVGLLIGDYNDHSDHDDHDENDDDDVSYNQHIHDISSSVEMSDKRG